MSCLNYSFNINNFSLCHHRVQTISNSQYNRSIPISSTCPTSFDWSLNLFAYANLAADRLIESSQQLEDFRHIVTYMKRIDLRILTSAYSPHFILPTFKYPLVFIITWKYRPCWKVIIMSICFCNYQPLFPYSLFISFV